MRQNFLKLAFIGFGFSAVALFVACTKQSKYDYEVKDHVESKAQVDETAEYIYAPSLTQASRTPGDARPYWMGETKIVKFKFTEQSLQIVEVDSDSRFQDNKANQKLVMEIPVDHLEYRCAKDKYGQCTNKEEENKEMAWNERSQFRPHFESTKITEVNLLPLEMEKIFGSNCYSEVSTNFIGAKLENGTLNLQIEKTFRGDVACLKSLEDLSDLTTTAIYHYSFTKLDSLASANYKAIEYPQTDEDFGFFNTKTKKLDSAFGDMVSSETIYMNRWNPEKEVITYYLSKEFEKSENAALKTATFKAFEKLNKGLQEAGVKFRLDLQSANGKIPGDIRYNFIVMVEDPVASSILGYGPVVANPKTGEILSGRVAMYPGVMKQFVRWTYDQILNEELSAKNQNNQASQQAGSTLNLKKTFNLNKELKQRLGERQKKATNKGSSISLVSPSSKEKLNSQTSHAKLEKAIDLTSLKQTLFGNKMARQEKLNDANRFAVMSKYCTYPAELFNFEEAVSVSLKTSLKVEELKPWEKMTDSEKQAAVDVILPEVWIPTLVHEMGHNLGLRHNFKGSEDKNNFYSRSELRESGVNVDIPYSSVMDYPKSDLNFLPSLGKYDIAALRFGYLRKVEDTKGQFVDVATTLTDLKKQLAKNSVVQNSDDLLKQYGYCTDEHVDVNVGCKRFDEGTTLVDMVKNTIQSYEESYARRNFRRDRRSFSKMGDAGAYSRLRDEFEYIRFNFEMLGRLKDKYGLEYDSKEYEDIEWLKDLKQAALIAGQFMIDVLETPDKTCIIADSEANEIKDVTPLADFSTEALSCDSIKLKPPFAIVGEFGKNINSMKDPESNNPYMDQIDVRGIWINKLAALRSLLNRSIGSESWDQNDDNFLDLPETRDQVISTLAGIMNGSIEKNLTVKLFDGQVLEMPVKIDFTNTHILDQPMDEGLATALKWPDRKLRFQEFIISKIRNSSNSRIDKSADELSVNNLFSVLKINSSTKIDTVKNSSILENSSIKYVATPENEIAKKMIDVENTKAEFEKIDRKEFQDAVVKRLNGQLKQKENRTKVEKYVLNLNDQKLELAIGFLTHNLPDSNFVRSMLDIMGQ